MIAVCPSSLFLLEGKGIGRGFLLTNHHMPKPRLSTQAGRESSSGTRLESLVAESYPGVSDQRSLFDIPLTFDVQHWNLVPVVAPSSPFTESERKSTTTVRGGCRRQASRKTISSSRDVVVTSLFLITANRGQPVSVRQASVDKHL